MNSTSRISSSNVKQKQYKSYTETLTAAYTCIQLPCMDHMEPSTPPNAPPPYLILTHSTPPMYDNLLCMCYEEKKNDPKPTASKEMVPVEVTKEALTFKTLTWSSDRKEEKRAMIPVWKNNSE